MIARSKAWIHIKNVKDKFELLTKFYYTREKQAKAKS